MATRVWAHRTLLVLALALALAPILAAAKPCAPGCEERGNCNLEEGRCEYALCLPLAAVMGHATMHATNGLQDQGKGKLEERQRNCPWGWAGPSCRELRIPACRTTNATAEPLVQCLPSSFPRSCECYRECRAYIKEMGSAIHTGWIEDDAKCFEREGLPTDEQLSNPPEDNEANVVYYRGFMPQTRRKQSKAQVMWWTNPWADRFTVLPLDKCPGSCHHQGACWQHKDNKEPVCVCWYGFGGNDCGRVRDPIVWQQEHCPNMCGGNGTCKRGWCHCNPGRFGIDCSRSQAFERPAKRLRKLGLAIYVYDLPSTLIHMGEWISEPGIESHDAIYVAYQKFMAQLLRDGEVVTENPWEANLFYVPALTMDWTSNLGNPWPHMTAVINHIRNAYPFWNETGGRDHLLWTTQDVGSCQAEEPAHVEVASFIQLTHYCHHGIEGRFKHPCFNISRDVCAVPYFPEAEQYAQEVFTPLHHRFHGVPATKASAAAAAPATRRTLQQSRHSDGAAQAPARSSETGANQTWSDWLRWHVRALGLQLAGRQHSYLHQTPLRPARQVQDQDGGNWTDLEVLKLPYSGSRPLPRPKPSSDASFSSGGQGLWRQSRSGSRRHQRRQLAADSDMTDHETSDEEGKEEKELDTAPALRRPDGSLHPRPLGAKPTLAFFAGDIRDYDSWYSGGVRQELNRLVAAGNLSRVRLNPKDMRDYWREELRGATFCLAPYGNGWGIRLIQVITAGCIPVIIQDRVFQFYEDVLPYWKFSVRLPKAELPRLQEVLEGIPPAEVARLQRGVVRFHRAFIWDDTGSGYGAAYEMTLASLERALKNLRGGITVPADSPVRRRRRRLLQKLSRQDW